MTVTGDVAPLPAQAGGVSGGARRQKVDLGIDGAGADRIETVIPVQKRYTFDVVVERLEFADGKPDGDSAKKPSSKGGDYAQDDIPF